MKFGIRDIFCFDKCKTKNFRKGILNYKQELDVIRMVRLQQKIRSLLKVLIDGKEDVVKKASSIYLDSIYIYSDGEEVNKADFVDEYLDYEYRDDVKEGTFGNDKSKD